MTTLPPTVNLKGRFLPAIPGNDALGKVNRSGDTMLGALTLSTDPGLPMHAATKQYVDAQIDANTRDKLTQARSFFVAKTGNDNNSGLSAGAAFLTIGKAIQQLATVEGGFQVVINVGAGTYAENVNLVSHLVDFAVLQTTTGAVIAPATGSPITANTLRGRWVIDGFKLVVVSGTYSSMNILRGSVIDFGNIEFGAAGLAHISATSNSNVNAASNYSVSGGATFHWAVSLNSTLSVSGKTITFSNSPAFTTFSICDASGVQLVNANTFTNGGTVTGQKFAVATNGTIDTQNDPAGVNYLPGNSAGTSATGGVYA